MADEAIGREIRQLRIDYKEDVSELKADQSKLLPREVYTARHEALERRISALEREVELAEASRVATRRWLVSAVVLPLVSMVVMIILAVT